MTVQNYQKVYSVHGTLHAVAVQTTLEFAGIPAMVAHAHNGAGFDVLVPEAWAAEAHCVLCAPPRSGEIFFVPSEN